MLSVFVYWLDLFICCIDTDYLKKNVKKNPVFRQWVDSMRLTFPLMAILMPTVKLSAILVYSYCFFRNNIFKVSHNHVLTCFGFCAFFLSPYWMLLFRLVGVSNDIMHLSSQFWKMCSTDTFAGAVIGCYSTLSHLSVTNKYEVSPWTMQAWIGLISLSRCFICPSFIKTGPML